MNAKVKKIVVLLSVAAFLFSALPASAQPPSDDWGEARDYRRGKVANFIEALDLTPEQQEQLRGQRQKHGETRKKLGQALRKGHIVLRRELEKEYSDEEKIKEIVSRINKVQAQIVKMKVKGILQVKEILTPEQFAKFNDLTKKRHEKMRKRHRKRTRGME